MWAAARLAGAMACRHQSLGQRFMTKDGAPALTPLSSCLVRSTHAVQRAAVAPQHQLRTMGVKGLQQAGDCTSERRCAAPFCCRRCLPAAVQVHLHGGKCAVSWSLTVYLSRRPCWKCKINAGRQGMKNQNSKLCNR